MREWFMDERVVKLMMECEKAGINTWQTSFNYKLERLLPKIRQAGRKIQFICLAASWHYVQTWGQVRKGVAKFSPFFS
jgi:hypothetical protein